MKNIAYLFLSLTLYTFVFPANAQIKIDGSTSTNLNPTDKGIKIDNGDRSGNNLFHSFQEFSVSPGTEAFFNNSNDIVNIFSRVTGGNISNIDGLIRANGEANLYLINPNGIVFGRGARLNIGGSFYGSTANSILFPDDINFSADDITKPLITINAPIGLSFRDNPQPIINRSRFETVTEDFTLKNNRFVETEFKDEITQITGLEVSKGKTLALIGGDIILDGGGITAKGGNIRLGGLSESGIVNIREDGSLVFPENIAKADLSLGINNGEANLDNKSLVDVTSNGGGSIAIDSRNLTLSDQSRLLAGITEEGNNKDALAGNITINSSDSIKLIGSNKFGRGASGGLDVGIANFVGLPPERFSDGNSSTAIGNGGSIIINTNYLEVKTTDAGIETKVNGNGNSGSLQINANELTIDDSGVGSFIFGNVSQRGDAGNVTINSEKITINNGVIASQVVNPDSQGNSSEVNINTDSLKITNPSFIISNNSGQGDAGNINITADSISLSGNPSNDFTTSINSGIGESTTGNGGDININTTSLTMSKNARLISSTKGIGNAGNITITAQDNIDIQNEVKIQSQVLLNAQGNAGNITINADSLKIENNASILSDTVGQGNAGNIALNIENELYLNNNILITSGISEENKTLEKINSGDINITTGSLKILNESSISANTSARGNAGNININTQENILLNEASLIQSQVLSTGIGNSGNITIKANNLSIENDSQILTDTTSMGNGGQITIKVNENLNLIDRNSNNEKTLITSGIAKNGRGNSGDLNITASKISLTDSFILVKAEGEGDSGSLSIMGESLTLNNGSISAASTILTPNTSNLTLNIDRSILLRNGSKIATDSSDNGNGGNININSDLLLAIPNQNNNINANAFEGNGGNINITAQSILGFQQGSKNNISANSKLGLSGKIEIDTLNTDAIKNILEFPTNTISADEIASNICSSNKDTKNNTLIVKGKGGIPASPSENLNAESLILEEDYSQLSNNQQQRQPDSIRPIILQDKVIYPARGIVMNDDGTISLTAYPTPNHKTRTPHNSPNCGN